MKTILLPDDPPKPHRRPTPWRDRAGSTPPPEKVKKNRRKAGRAARRARQINRR